jgi:hypothetical protein
VVKNAICFIAKQARLLTCFFNAKKQIFYIDLKTKNGGKKLKNDFRKMGFVNTPSLVIQASK